ncbi:MAG: MFS transporter [Acidobacteria bacterium]|nr:MFS transporter [Acidobacteriota bacterium]
MIGDGVESGYLSPYLVGRGMAINDVASIMTVYGTTAAIAGWFSGALSDVWGPRRVIVTGWLIWLAFQVAFLKIGLLHATPSAVMLTYGLRGFGYPLFAFGFLVWITVAAPKYRMASAMGWFWFAFTGGLPTLGSLVARYSIPRIGAYNTFWISTGLVMAGGIILLAGVRETRGARRLVEEDKRPVAALLHSVALAWRKPKIGIACIVRIINTAPEFGFFIILPGFFEDVIGFSQAQFLTLLSAIFLSNILWNLLFGLIGDRFGWRMTVATCGGFGSAVTTLLLFYIPLATHNYVASIAVGMLYGATLAGYVPLSALMPMLAPEHRGEALSMLNLGAGAAMQVGPLLVRVFFHHVGVKGMMWIFAGLYLASGLLALMLTTDEEMVEAV